MTNTIKVKFKGFDEWGRKMYKNIETGKVYKDVDGWLHTITKDGEPDCPLRKDLTIIIVED